MVAVASSRYAWPVDHTPDVGGVVALCGLVRALSLDSIVGTVPRFGLVDQYCRLRRRFSLFLCVGVCFLFMLSFSSSL
jgi:hypothetical protein